MTASARLTFLALIASLACAGSETDQRESAMALRAPLAPVVGARQSWSFTVKRNGLHEVSLEFAWPIEATAVADVVERATQSVGTGPVPAELDFTWQILEGENELAAGSSRQGVRRITSASNSRALVFGTFSAKTGVSYTVRWVSQFAFEPLLRAQPVLLIEPAVSDR